MKITVNGEPVPASLLEQELQNARKAEAEVLVEDDAEEVPANA